MKIIKGIDKKLTKLCKEICGDHDCSADPYCPLLDPKNKYYDKEIAEASGLKID